jgi:Zn-dependent protease
MNPLSHLYSGDIQGFLLSLLFILPAIVVALSFHEAAHAWMANKMGDPTAKNLGRMSLDPTKHFDIFGFISFVLLGFGWGKPVPTNARNYYNYKKANVLVALSGVTMNLIISLITLIIICVLVITGTFMSVIPRYLLPFDFQLTFIDIVHTILFYIASLNLTLCFFNLIPIPPLDGHHLVKGYIARKSPNFYMNYQRYGFIALILLLYVTPLGSYIGQLVLLIFRGIGTLFGVPFMTIY